LVQNLGFKIYGNFILFWFQTKGHFGFVNDTIHLEYDFELINSQWRVVKFFFKIVKRQNNKICHKKMAK
jgi:hypothetical protein